MIMRFSLLSRRCRKGVILKSLGEASPPDCGICDTCQPASQNARLGIFEEAAAVLSAVDASEHKMLDLTQLLQQVKNTRPSSGTASEPW
jgi:superfamily II DNA helicase RecQ